MSFELPAIVKLAERVMLDIELIVGKFPRDHRYTVGTRLRDQALVIRRCCDRAWFDKPRQQEWTERLAFAIDDLKFLLQHAKLVKAFKSFAQFEALARLVSDLGRQCGGWKKQQQVSGQNESGYRAEIQRPQRLSARSASGEAKS